MSYLSQLTIHHLRNLTDVDLQLGPRCNIFYGQNGSGKTSLLEAIHYLGLGRSFRTRHHSSVINHDQPNFTLFAHLQMDTTQTSIGLSRSRNGASQLKLAGSATSLSNVADLLPLQLIHPDGHKLLTAGPKLRRQYLDWGVFHVEHSFYPNWQRVQRAIIQRNKQLKEMSSQYRYDDLLVWDHELAAVSEMIHESRLHYIEQLKPIVESTFAEMKLDIPLVIDYNPGWDVNQKLQDVLRTNFNRDKKIGYTSQGPHKADLILKVANKPAHEVISQGQQKMLVYALKLSQSQLLHQQTNKQCIFLIDDLPAELDEERRASLTQQLMKFSSQIFITGIESTSLNTFIETTDSTVFHVEHGKVEATISA